MRCPRVPFSPGLRGPPGRSCGPPCWPGRGRCSAPGAAGREGQGVSAAALPGGEREGGRVLTVFSLSLSARLFMGDSFFMGDRQGWSRRAASGARAGSMAARQGRRHRVAGEESRAPPLYIPFELGARTPGCPIQSRPRLPHSRFHWLTAGLAPPPIVAAAAAAAAAAGGKAPPSALAPDGAGEKPRELGGLGPAGAAGGARFAAGPGMGAGEGAKAALMTRRCAVPCKGRLSCGSYTFSLALEGWGCGGNVEKSFPGKGMAVIWA